MMVLIEVLAHVLQFIQVSELSLLIVHDDLLLFLDGFDDLFHLAVEVNVHALDIVSFGLQAKQAQEFFFLFLKVDSLSAFAHAAWRVWSKAEEVTKDIILVRCFLDLSSSIPSSALRRRGWTLLVIISDDMLVAGWVNHGLSLLHVSNRRH